MKRVKIGRRIFFHAQVVDREGCSANNGCFLCLLSLIFIGGETGKLKEDRIWLGNNQGESI